MKPDIWMPLYIGDYLADTMGLTTEQHGAYLLLIMAYWKAGGPLPDDNNELSAVTGLMRDAWLTHRSRIARFFVVADGKWTHARIEKEIVRSKKNQESRSKAGKSAAYKRWSHKDDDAPRITDVCVAHASGNANAMRLKCPSPSPSELNLYSGAVELPSGFPETLQDAIAGAMAIGCPDDFIEATWNKATGRGGRDAKDIPIRKWSSFVATEWKYNKDRIEREKLTAEKPATAATQSQKPAGSFWQFTKELELVEAEMKAIEGRASRDAFGMIFQNDEQREKYKRLKIKRKELKGKLGLQ